jgi:hypothetical protein
MLMMFLRVLFSSLRNGSTDERVGITRKKHVGRRSSNNTACGPRRDAIHPILRAYRNASARPGSPLLSASCISEPGLPPHLGHLDPCCMGKCTPLKNVDRLKKDAEGERSSRLCCHAFIRSWPRYAHRHTTPILYCASKLRCRRALATNSLSFSRETTAARLRSARSGTGTHLFPANMRCWWLYWRRPPLIGIAASSLRERGFQRSGVSHAMAIESGHGASKQSQSTRHKCVHYTRRRFEAICKTDEMQGMQWKFLVEASYDGGAAVLIRYR